MGNDFISQEELNEIIKSGGKVSQEKDIIEVPGLSELVQKLSEMVSSNKQLSDNQNEETRKMLSVIIDRLSSGTSIDTAPIATAIAGFKPQIIERKNNGFIFTIDRNQRGLATSIKAVPIQ